MASMAAHGRQMSSSTPYRSPVNSAYSKNNRTGFLGPTAYSAVYTENSGSLSVPELEDVDPTDALPPVHPDLIKRGAEVLALFQDMPRYRRFTQRWLDLSESSIVLQPVFRIWFDDMWNEFEDIWTDPSPEQLYALSEMVWRNTRQSIEVHGNMTPGEWARTATGKNLRWEIIGLILSLVGLVAVNLSDWDSIFDDIRDTVVDRATFAERMRQASELVLCFCYECECLNDHYICFMYEGLMLIELLKGDTHYVAWQRNGELCDAMVAMGLHQGNPQTPDMPFFLSQQRRKIFAKVYTHDKSISLFVGRPPRLSYRYCKLEMPLDLSGDQLMLQGAELQEAIANLDRNGWNTTGDCYRVTWNRVWFLYSRIREDILEVSLGSLDEDVEMRIAEIWQQMSNLDVSLPDFVRLCRVRLAPEEGLNAFIARGGRSNKHGNMSDGILSALFVQLGIMQTEFLLRRAQVNRMKTNTETLIPISRRMLKLVLLAQSRRDFFRDFQGDVACLMAEAGVSTAGVLAVELLKQEQSPQITQDILPRSETIQDISVFTSLLADVRTGDANHHICQQGCRALKGALEKILSPSAPAAISVRGQGDTERPFEDMSFYMPTANDAEFLQWLDNVEWDKGFFNPAIDTGEGL
ncbi:hypothetical protein Q7P37_002101 [Cladosporium fusiforme]